MQKNILQKLHLIKSNKKYKTSKITNMRKKKHKMNKQKRRHKKEITFARVLQYLFLAVLTVVQLFFQTIQHFQIYSINDNYFIATRSVTWWCHVCYLPLINFTTGSHLVSRSTKRLEHETRLDLGPFYAYATDFMSCQVTQLEKITVKNFEE